MKRWSCDRPATFEVIWRNMMWHDITWHDVTLRDMTWHDMAWHDVTWGISRGMMWHDVKWRDIMLHNATWRNVTWRTRRDVSVRVILISTQQEWTLLHVRWPRYCQKTIETFLGLNLFIDIFIDIDIICAPASTSPKKIKKVEAHQNWVGKIVLKFNWPASDFDLTAPRMNSSACKMAEILSKNY